MASYTELDCYQETPEADYETLVVVVVVVDKHLIGSWMP